MRLSSEQQRQIEEWARAKEQADADEHAAHEQKMRETGEPIRDEYPSRKAYRAAMSKWKRSR